MYVSGLSLSIGNVAQMTSSSQDEDVNMKALSEATFLETVHYVLSRLLHENKELTYVANFKIFYKSSTVDPSVIESALEKLLLQYTIVPTIVPVKHLQNPNTIVSICALRHYWTNSFYNTPISIRAIHLFWSNLASSMYVYSIYLCNVSWAFDVLYYFRLFNVCDK